MVVESEQDPGKWTIKQKPLRQLNPTKALVKKSRGNMCVKGGGPLRPHSTSLALSCTDSALQ